MQMNNVKCLIIGLLLSSLSSSVMANSRFSCNTLQLMNAEPLVEDMIDRILEIANIKQKYNICRSADSSNAFALIYKNKRTIIYDSKFIHKLAKDVKELHWGKVTILAHEIGHHKFQHTDRLGKLNQLDATRRYAIRRQFELQADQFAGTVLARMGASLENSQALVASLEVHLDDPNSTHPSAQKRIIAVTNGWKKGCRQIRSNCNSAGRAHRPAQAPIIHSPLGNKATPHYVQFMQQAEKHKGGHINTTYCKSYAAISVQQAKRSLQHQCDFNVDKAHGQWSTQYVPQYDWCLGASAYASSGEIRFREKKLASCIVR